MVDKEDLSPTHHKNFSNMIETDQFSSSWSVFSNTAVLKKMDKTVFLHQSTRIPKTFRQFFEISDLKPEEKRSIILWNQDHRYEVTVEMIALDFPRTNISWKKDFANLIKTRYPQWYNFFNKGGVESDNTPSLKFLKRSTTDEYDIEFIDDSPAEQGILLENPEELILIKYHEYSRKDVHDIFDKNSRFTPRSGKWGIRGIVSHPYELNDFIFFVTFGHKESGFSFEEFVTEGGVLTWQSEPKQQLKDPIIRTLISHDHTKNNIHLFLRTGKGRKYCYLGRLAYIAHDNERDQPVHFKWQILDWDINEERVKEIGLDLKPDNPIRNEIFKETQSLIHTQPPESIHELPKVGESSIDFIGKKLDFPENEQKKREIGRGGEDLVINWEMEMLKQSGCSDLINKIEHISITQGDGAGYDIRSIGPDGAKKYIEVKTTVGGKNTPFNLSKLELNFSKYHPDDYFLYRIYDYDRKTKTGKFYILTGDLSSQFFLEPVQFKCYPQRNSQQKNNLVL